MLPHVMEYNLPLRAEKYAEVAKCFRVHDPSKSVEDNARACIKAIAQFSIAVGTARSITEMGGSEKDLADLVDQATLDLCSLANPKIPTAEEVLAMYKKGMENKEL